MPRGQRLDPDVARRKTGVSFQSVDGPVGCDRTATGFLPTLMMVATRSPLMTDTDPSWLFVTRGWTAKVRSGSSSQYGIASRESFQFGDGGRHVLRLQRLADAFGELDQAVREAPLVVVPAEDLYLVSDGLGERGVEDR